MASYSSSNSTLYSEPFGRWILNFGTSSLTAATGEGSVVCLCCVLHTSPAMHPEPHIRGLL